MEILRKGARSEDEPLYLPFDNERQGAMIHLSGYFRSVLHFKIKINIYIYIIHLFCSILEIP